MIKICKKCEKEFNALSGHLIYCNVCAKKRNEERAYEERKNKKKYYYKNYNLLRNKWLSEKGKEKMRKYLQQYYQNNKKKYQDWCQKYYKKDKDKWTSRNITNKLLIKDENSVCKVCDSKLNLQIHHEIYPIKTKEIKKAIRNKKIYLLCRKCHGKLRRKKK